MSFFKKFFARKPHCPRCDSKNHSDPNVHNTRVMQAVDQIAELRLEMLDAELSQPDGYNFDAKESKLAELQTYAEDQAWYADPEYQELEHLITLSMQRS